MGKPGKFSSLLLSGRLSLEARFQTQSRNSLGGESLLQRPEGTNNRIRPKQRRPDYSVEFLASGSACNGRVVSVVPGQDRTDEYAAFAHLDTAGRQTEYRPACRLCLEPTRRRLGDSLGLRYLLRLSR